MGQSDRQDQPGIGYQASKAIWTRSGVIAWQHPMGAPCFGPVFSIKTIIPEAGSTFSSPHHGPALIVWVDWGLNMNTHLENGVPDTARRET